MWLQELWPSATAFREPGITPVPLGRRWTSHVSADMHQLLCLFFTHGSNTGGLMWGRKFDLGVRAAWIEGRQWCLLSAAFLVWSSKFREFGYLSIDEYAQEPWRSAALRRSALRWVPVERATSTSRDLLAPSWHPKALRYSIRVPAHVGLIGLFHTGKHVHTYLSESLSLSLSLSLGLFRYLSIYYLSTSICVCLYVCIYIYIYIHTYLYINAYVSLSLYIYIYIYICMHNYGLVWNITNI